jgi:hypothetical protein
MKTPCPGCGLPDADQCQQLFNELSAYTLTHGGREFIHQHVVDAHGAQHGGGSPSNIRLAFSLIGLYLALEKGYTGREVQLAHMRLGKTRRQYPAHPRPAEFAKLTVADPMGAEPGKPRDEMILKWAAAVWDSWASAQPWTRETVTKLL